MSPENIIRTKYADADNLFAGSCQGGFHLWKSLHKIKHLFKVGAKYEVRNGTRTNFWADWWIEDEPLKDSFPHLYAICDNPAISVAQACLQEGLTIRFCRSLDQEDVLQWSALQTHVEHFHMSEGLEKI
jgi:hypothetical protein